MLPVLCLFAVSFYQQVLPVLEKHCLGCHRAGELAPSFETYAQARPYARAMREAVQRNTMPPWDADSKPGEFLHDLRLAGQERETIIAWTGLEGTPRAAVLPPVESFHPDAVFQMPAEFIVPPRKTIDYQRFIVPTGFREGRWVDAIRVVPGNRKVVHHAVVYVRPPRSEWLRTPGGRLSSLDEVLDAYLPGAAPRRFPSGQAKWIPAGSDLVFELHYSPVATEEQDRTRVELHFAAGPPRERVYTMTVARGDFEIPAHAANFEVKASFAFETAVTVLAVAPHMHLRGRAMYIDALLPDGSEQTLLETPRYRFNWQIRYEFTRPIALPHGTEVAIVAVYDNRDNDKAIHWGDQSWEEMLVAFFDVALPPGLEPAEIWRKKRF